MGLAAAALTRSATAVVKAARGDAVELARFLDAQELVLSHFR